MFTPSLVGLSVLQGIGVLLVLLGIFVVALYRGHGEGEARALTFTTLVVANLGLILTNRSWSASALQTLQTPTPALWWVLGGAVAALGFVLYVPFLRDLFGFAVLHPDDLALCLAAGIFSVLWFEGLKLIWRRHGSTTRPAPGARPAPPGPPGRA